MHSNGPGQINITPQIPPDIQGASTTALILEIIFGFFGLLGVGHVYSGRTALGILLMIGWWIFMSIGFFLSTLTFGIATCLFAPLYIAGPILSGIQARMHVQREMTTGSWPNVAFVAGGGCLFIVFVGIIFAVLGVLSVGFFSFLGLESY